MSLQTLMCEVEAITNSRPLTMMSSVLPRYAIFSFSFICALLGVSRHLNKYSLASLYISLLLRFVLVQCSLCFHRCSFILRLNIYLASFRTFSCFGVSPIRFVQVVPLPVFYLVHFLSICCCCFTRTVTLGRLGRYFPIRQVSYGGVKTCSVRCLI